jgi:hypothetical protein
MSSGCSQKLLKRVGVACPQGALNNCKKGGGRMSLGCSEKLQKGWGSHVLRVFSVSFQIDVLAHCRPSTHSTFGQHIKPVFDSGISFLLEVPYKGTVMVALIVRCRQMTSKHAQNCREKCLSGTVSLTRGP